MCQLTYISLNNKELNKIALFYSLVFNSVSHKDGCGFYCDRLFKTELTGYIITNLGEIINDFVVSKKSIIGHVRQASVGSVIKLENAHPFESDNLILAHNGTLYEKKETSEKELDTIKFLNALERKYKGDLPNALIETMKGFDGKFAFLIKDKNNSKYYAARGKTAKLFTTYITLHKKEGEEKLGYIINTEKDSLDYTLRFLVNFASLSGKKISMEPLKELKEETIFELKDKDFEPISEIKETEKKFYVQPYYRRFPVTTGTDVKDLFDYSRNSLNRAKETQEDEEIYAELLLEFCETYAISTVELDVILFVLFGKTRLSISSEDLDMFLDGFAPLIQFSKSARKYINRFVDKNGFLNNDFYNKHKLPFPYFINESGQIIRCINIERKESR